MELKLYIKQANNFNAAGQPIVFIGGNPSTLTPVINGTLPSNRQWPNYGNFIDVTDNASDLFKLQINWSAERTTDGNISTLTEVKKTSSGTITLEDEAFKLIKKWLFEDVSAPLNSVDVKIEHVGCGTYEDFRINATDITYCESNPQLCTFDVILKQNDENLKCIQNTVIADNWQGWFQNNTTKQHPRFTYCNEQRPNGLLVAIWVVLSILFTLVQIIVVPILLFLNLVFIIVNGIISVINAIINAFSFLGLNPITPLNPPPTVSDFFKSIAATYLETAGCGREHPAPLIRDYIKNVCDKCGITVDSVTAPVFFSPTIQLNTSSRGVINETNLHYNATYLFANVKRGIRRARGVFGLFSSAATQNQDHYIEDNSPLLTLDQFLDQLKGLYNAEWRLKNNKLYFQRRDYYKNGGTYLYDFSATSGDRLKLLEGICFEWNEIKNKAAWAGLYADDPSDKPGNEARAFMNDYISFGDAIKNPVYDGLLDKRQTFGATNFRLMGITEDYILDAFQSTLDFVTAFVLLFPLFIPIRNAIEDALYEFADYALLIQGETAQLPKILIWNAGSTKNAKAVQSYNIYPINNSPAVPINYNYNTSPFYDKYEINTDVRNGNGSVSSPGSYDIIGFFGAYKRSYPAKLVNYPMYTAIGFQNTMWDWFHWIDDPNKYPKLNLRFTAKIEMCCDDLKKIGAFGNGDNIALGDKVKLTAPFYQEGIISEFEVSYDPEKDEGQYIIIKGNL